MDFNPHTARLSLQCSGTNRHIGAFLDPLSPPGDVPRIDMIQNLVIKLLGLVMAVVDADA